MGVMDVSFGNKKLRLNIFGDLQGPLTDSCFKVDTSEDLIEEATLEISTQDALESCLAHFGVDDFDINGYCEEVNSLLDTSHNETTPLWITKYEPLPEYQMAPVSESPIEFEQKLLSDAPIDTMNQEARLAYILEEHKDNIGWDIYKMRDDEKNELLNDLSPFGTTFELGLQNLNIILKRCKETDLVLTWKECHRLPEKIIQSEGGTKINLVDRFSLLPPKEHNKSFKLRWSIPFQYVLIIQGNRRLRLYQLFSAITTRPPD